MRKLILILLTMFLFSCEKEKTVIMPDPVYCFKCKVTTTYTATNYQSVVKTDSITKCGWTQKEMDYYINIKSEPLKILTNGGMNTLTATSKYDCKIK